MHLLPVAVSVVAGSIAGTRLAVRLGTKVIVTAGLALQAGFYFWVAADITPSFSYGIIAAAFLPAQPPRMPEPEHRQAELPETASHGKDLAS